MHLAFDVSLCLDVCFATCCFVCPLSCVSTIYCVLKLELYTQIKIGLTFFLTQIQGRGLVYHFKIYICSFLFSFSAYTSFHRSICILIEQYMIDVKVLLTMPCCLYFSSLHSLFFKKFFCEYAVLLVFGNCGK
uniref:Uncharacterized protein MANES_01G037500 n=1 Tax=Rhizophora mucronata TaxID=61149 RepID=A0A2P2MHF7_RHIMU